ncbi:GNAT family N-acetyltransferase [Pseudonocardia sp. KRD291]|uniref:GNAT family N-acetyltransferase n=1 Tax=Pseudonocardia sp. KRD291 TaxID=2792007 RepID=UPI001C4A2BA7|nr:GNAT family N-acetyltransferase [Pseudonocardia sp. KRD291]MBW0106813.1 GNAT family N-acetyltransferase [Pseudonocardia sp. KRD291]
MTEYPHVRVLEPDELRASTDLFRAALHVTPLDDDGWGRGGSRHVPGRTFGAFEQLPSGGGPELAPELVGTAMSFPCRTAVPGGAGVDTAAVSLVGVRADRTRRGHLSALMRAQLTDAADRGEVLATLRASETGIYGRFGYGIATRGRTVRIRGGAELRPDAPGGGTVRMLSPQRARTELPALHDRFALRRAGGMTRFDGWWPAFLEGTGPVAEFRGTAVHSGPHGDDGWAVWAVDHDQAAGDTVRLLDLHAADATASADLWRFLLGMDLVADVTGRLRPLDEDLSLLLADPRAFRVEGLADETWMRMVDVTAALGARTWGEAAPVVLRVHDRLLPANDGTVRIGPDGPKPVEGTVAADLECDVDALAMAYLGDRRPSELVAAGRWRAHDDAAVARADALFATADIPWCGTFF